MLTIVIMYFVSTAKACSVCGFGQDGSRDAYLFTTALLTLIPLSIMGGMAYFAWRKFKARGPHEN